MKKITFVLILALSTLALAGCDGQQSKTPVSDAGIYKSVDKGNKWVQDVGVAGFPRTGSLANTSVLAIYFDPSDLKTIYLTTEGAGLYYSYNSGENWQQSLSLNKGIIQALAIDPKDKCTLYVANEENVTVLKTIDCTRSWEKVFYLKEKEDQSVTSLAILPSDSKVIYAGTSLGYIYKSADQGLSWHLLNTKPLGNKIVNILIDPSDNNVIYLPTERKGIFKTTDGGLTGLDKPLAFTCEGSEKECKNNSLPVSNSTYRALIFNPSKANSLIYASDYGIIKSENGGQTWATVILLNPAGKAVIKAVAVNPTNDKELYYVTNTTFYRSIDGGKNWTTKKLPTTKPPAGLYLDPINNKTLYLILKVPPQK
ncbi:MAG: hypothetical protein V1892_02265 [bacterium]